MRKQQQHPKISWAHVVRGQFPVALLASTVLGCGGTGDPEDRQALTMASVSVSLELDERHQTLEGFGAAVAWYDDWLTEHPNQEELYQVLFGDLGLDILRLRNRFRYQSEFSVESAEIVREGSSSIGRDLTVLLSSWSPPRSLKANGQEDCQGETSCTLIRRDGEFVYDEFGDYWNDSLDAYAEIGIVPKYISIQNEPDYLPTGWEGCHFSPNEDADYPGYDRALDAVYQRVSERDEAPKILGPETIGVTNGKVQGYANAMDLGQLSGIAHHLYDGNTWQRPDDFVLALRALRSDFGDHPIFQTEFSADDTENGGAFETAWLIHNSLVEADAAAYIYWDLIWPRGGLVAVESPQGSSSWSTEKGYEIRGPYYSMRHFARFTDPGFVRVGATSSSRAIRVSAFESPEEDRVTIVLLNVDANARKVNLTHGLAAFDSEVYQTTADAPWKALGAWVDAEERSLPARSITSVALTKR